MYGRKTVVLKLSRMMEEYETHRNHVESIISRISAYDELFAALKTDIGAANEEKEKCDDKSTSAAV